MRVSPAALLVALALAGCLEPAPAPGADATPDEEALALGLRVIGTYLASDYAAFRALLADRIYTLEGEGPHTREDVDAWFAQEQPFPDGRDYSGYTLGDYHATYAPEVWTFEEARERFPEFANVTWEGWTPGEEDRIFYGSLLREGKASFLWDDLLSFAVSREGGEWRFRAFSG